MKTTLATLVLIGVIVMHTAAVIAADGPADLGIITGSEKGTYYRFGLDLQKIVKPSGINLAVHPSKGSIDNIYAVYQQPGVQIGIVQADVLAYITRVQSNPAL